MANGSGCRAIARCWRETSGRSPTSPSEIRLLIAEPPRLASRLAFDCTPKGRFLGLDVGGKRVSFTENVFYEFREGKIAEVWSVIDKAAIEAQLPRG